MRLPRLKQLAPGLSALRKLTPDQAMRDVLAGLSVATVAIPIGLAYAALMGLAPSTGLYASIFPVIAYAIFGPSARLIVGPDAATCTLIAAALTALELSGPDQRAQGAAALAIGAGFACFLASRLKLGFIANFLSRPILTGYLTGVAVNLMLSQIPKLTGVSIPHTGIVQTPYGLFQHLQTISIATLLTGLSVFAILRAMKKWHPQIPAAVIIIAFSILISWLFNFEAFGIDTLGDVPRGLAWFSLPSFAYQPETFISAVLGVFIISFSSGIVTARSFANKLERNIDANRELQGFGMANLVAGLFQGFTITGADSRTAVNYAAGGSSPLVAIVSALTIALVVIFLTEPLAYLPQAVLGAILASAAIDLINIGQFRTLWRISKAELILALIATVGVIWLGVLPGVIVAVIATMGNLLRLAVSPRDALLGSRPDSSDIVKLHLDPQAQIIPGFVIYLFEGSIVFFNAETFLRRSSMMVKTAQNMQWFVLDASVMTQADASTIEALEELDEEVRSVGARLVIAGGHRNFRRALERSGFIERLGGPDYMFDSSEQAVRFLKERIIPADKSVKVDQAI
ncbi:SulP family inorganic anion transporter [Microvirga sp. W0021]|uniref:SulP family inorganic anion transporter n=1 Tax=Hohaiivirga grylli TaxID=3133970 RepID=A0ABV0BK76_9HYPH